MEERAHEGKTCLYNFPLAVITNYNKFDDIIILSGNQKAKTGPIGLESKYHRFAYPLQRGRIKGPTSC